MKKILLSISFIVLSVYFLTILNTNENENEFKISKGENLFEIQRRGCCSWHGGVDGCSGGRVVCSDGTLSPSCTCHSNIDPLAGCTI